VPSLIHLGVCIDLPPLDPAELDDFIGVLVERIPAVSAEGD
jgi:hypothetical protein